MAYDRADWHYGGDFPPELPRECGGTHIGIFLAWVILNGLEGEVHREAFSNELRKVRSRLMTGRQFLMDVCDEKFNDEDLNDEGNAFARDYYLGEDGKGYGRYLDDYTKVLAAKCLRSFYHVEDTWENYDRLAPVIDRRFAQWRRRRR